MKYYQYNGANYTLAEARTLFPHISIPAVPDDEDMVALGFIVLPETAIPPSPDEVKKNLQQAKEEKLAEINAAVSSVLKPITKNFPQEEMLSFSKQEAEARLWLQDNSAPTPFLTTIARIRNLDMAELVNRVLSNTDDYSLEAAIVIGQGQTLKDKVEACTMIEQVLDIDISVINRGNGNE